MMILIHISIGLWIGFMSGYEIADDKVISSNSETEFCEPQMIFGNP